MEVQKLIWNFYLKTITLAISVMVFLVLGLANLYVKRYKHNKLVFNIAIIKGGYYAT